MILFRIYLLLIILLFTFNINSEKTKCVLYDTEDSDHLSTFIKSMKSEMLKMGKKINIENPIDSLQKSITSMKGKENIIECFALTAEQSDDLSPSITIKSLDGINKLKEITDDYKTSESPGKLNELIEIINNIKSKDKSHDSWGMEWYCKNKILLDDKNRYSPIIYNYCKFITNFKH